MNNDDAILKSFLGLDDDPDQDIDNEENYGDIFDIDDHESDISYEAAEAQSRQYEYEMSLSGYDQYHPKVRFKHSFMSAGYLPVTIIKHDYDEPSFDDVVQMMSDEAVTPKGKTNQLEFCRIWHDIYRYEYSGVVITPKGAISLDRFKHEIIMMLAAMGTETINTDAVTKHICDMYIQMYVTDDGEAREDLIPFKNGDLYINHDKRGYTFHENQFTPVLYRFDYDFVNAPNLDIEPEFPNFKKWKDDLFSEEDQYTLKQMLGYLMQPKNDAQEAFFVVGQACTGKSILTSYIIPALLGKASVMAQVTELFSDKFQTSATQGKLCVYDDDIGEANLTKEETGNFKSFVSGSMIKVERKYADPINIKNTAKLVCCGNHMIYSDDKTEGFTRRLHPIYILPRNIENKDSTLGYKVIKEIQMIALWALDGLLEMYGEEEFKPYWSERTMDRMLNYSESQKWEEKFIEETFEFKEGAFLFTEDIRDALENYMKDNRDLPYDFRKNWRAVKKWLTEEGCDKYRFVYKRGVKKGDKYNGTGYSHMAFREHGKTTDLYYDEKGRLMLHIVKRKPEEQEEE